MFDKDVSKIIFTGPVGAGKSTAINAISDIPVISTEQIATDEVKDKKRTTTVAMDYGILKLEQGENIHLYGTPGQERFSFMWEILVENAIGIIIMVDSANDEPLADLDFFLNNFSSFITSKAIAVGITRTDISNKHDLNQYHQLLNKYDLKPPIFEVDARKKREISMLVQALLFSVDQGLEETNTEEIA